MSEKMNVCEKSKCVVEIVEEEEVKIVEQGEVKKEKGKKVKKEKVKMAKVKPTPINGGFTKLNKDCWIGRTNQGVCYNAVDNRKKLVKGLKIRYRHNPKTYKKTDDWETGEIVKIVAPKKKNEFLRTEKSKILVLNDKTDNTDSIYTRDTLIWAIDSDEPPHEIFDGRICWGGDKYKKKELKWEKDYDVNYTPPIRKPAVRTTKKQDRENYMAILQGASGTIQDMRDLMEMDDNYKLLVEKIATTLKITKPNKKLIGM